jgi:hypothetical protein
VNKPFFRLECSIRGDLVDLGRYPDVYPDALYMATEHGTVLTNAEAVRLAVALIQATPDDDTQYSDLVRDPVRYALAIIRAAKETK